MSKRQLTTTMIIIALITILTIVILAFVAKSRATEDSREQKQAASQPPSIEDCSAQDVYVMADLALDRDTSPTTGEANVILNNAANQEMPINCPANVYIKDEAGQKTELEFAGSRYGAGAGLGTEIELWLGSSYTLEVDLGQDGTIDITGSVRLSDIDPGQVVARVDAQSAKFEWVDQGDPEQTTVYWQISDKVDLMSGLDKQFSSGCTQGDLVIAQDEICDTRKGQIKFDGSKFPYFEEPVSNVYARFQTETQGSLIETTGRFVGWTRFDDAALCVVSGTNQDCPL